MSKNEYEKICDCSNEVLGIIEILKNLNDTCFEMTCQFCDFYSDDKKLKANAIELVRVRPQLYSFIYVIGEELKHIEELTETINTEAYKIFFEKEKKTID